MPWVEKNRKNNNRGRGGGRLFGTREYSILHYSITAFYITLARHYRKDLISDNCYFANMKVETSTPPGTLLQSIKREIFILLSKQGIFVTLGVSSMHFFLINAILYPPDLVKTSNIIVKTLKFQLLSLCLICILILNVQKQPLFRVMLVFYAMLSRELSYTFLA